MAKDLAAAAKAKDIKYFLISFVDLPGQLRSVRLKRCDHSRS